VPLSSCESAIPGVDTSRVWPLDEIVRSSSRASCFAIAALASGCYTGAAGSSADTAAGSDGGTLAGDGDGGASESGDETGDPAACTSTQSPGAPVPMRRLTALQVRRSVTEVLGVDAPLTVADEKLFTFKSNVSSAVDFAGARGYFDFAEDTVAAADLSQCAEAGPTCTTWLLDDVGRRLFRRSLSATERTGYEALFAEGSAEDGPTEGARWVLEGLLQSPSFLYMDEAVRDDGYLDDHAMAARLALTLWGANPDAALLDRADAGELSTPEQLADEAARLLADARSVGGLTDFVDQWLRLERLNDPDARPDLEALGPETLAAMRAEPVQLLGLLLAQQEDLTALLTSNETTTSPLVAALYGDDIVDASGATTVLDPARRAGMLSLPGVMAALSHAEGSSPTLRGYAVLANLLCTPPPPPPPGVDVTLPEVGPDATTRERLEAHFSDPSCASCHAPMDGMGFAFESLDWLGRSRDEEHGKPIDDTSTFPLDGADVSVDGPVELAAVLAESPSAARCVVRQWTSYGAGTPDKEEAACLVDELAAQASGPDGLRAMILGLVSSDWYRRGPGESP
jgi:Protein of unknown function (DUF1592)/Protein of unknown function (DUF1588)/Protein of unknown function (DUF1595)/Protein of unknown function (DUF1585)